MLNIIILRCNQLRHGWGKAIAPFNFALSENFLVEKFLYKNAKSGDEKPDFGEIWG